MEKENSLEVFISYSWDDEKHKQDVLALADKLRVDDGIDCLLDVYVKGTPHEGWPRWMEKSVERAKYVLVLCSEKYLEKWRGEGKTGRGKGVKFESLLTSNMLADNDSLNAKFIPVVVKEGDEAFIPLPLKGASYYNIYNQNEYDSLVRHITEQPIVEKPLLGERRHLSPTNILEKDISAQQYKDIEKKLKTVFDESLRSFSGLPIFWVEPRVYTKDENTHSKADEETRIYIQDIVSSKNDSFIINARQQYGLTSLAHRLVYEFWIKEEPAFWLYIDANELKPYPREIEKIARRKLKEYDVAFEDIEGVILDEFSSDTKEADKLLQATNRCFDDKRMIIMHTFTDGINIDKNIELPKNRSFGKYYLWALSRSKIRDVVSQYNNESYIGNEDDIINKVTQDLEALNIPRTPLNCLTLLKVSEFAFDDGPVNRTDMLEKVLFLLFNIDKIPKYKTRPDLKDTQFVLGYLSEILIRKGKYSFDRETILKDICTKQKIDLDIEIVFDVLYQNNIIVYRYGEYIFKFRYWIFYFAAHRMHQSADFTDFILENMNYISYPEIIEFYTGIDRRRDNAIETLLEDLKYTRKNVEHKCGFIKDFNIYDGAKWNPSDKELQHVQNEVSSNVQESKLPDEIKDEYSDRTYDRVRPLDQTINEVLEKYSLQRLIRSIQASSIALRNSDYSDAEKREHLLHEIMQSWHQITKVMLVLAPILAKKRTVSLEGATFALDENDFKGTDKEIFYAIIETIPTNIMGWYKDDIFSRKMAPLLYDMFDTTSETLTRHYLALLLLNKKPRGWNRLIERYIKDEGKNTYYLFDLFHYMMAEYKYGFASEGDIKNMNKLLKMIIAKHDRGIKEPGSKAINKVPDSALPDRIED